MSTNSDSFSKLSPELLQKFTNFKNTPRPPDSRTKEQKEQSRSNLLRRIAEYKEHKNYEKIQLQNIIKEQERKIQEQNETIKKQNDELLQMKHLIETRIGKPLKFINRESPSTNFFNSAKSKKTGGKKHQKTAKNRKKT